jgi:hypothetical protein
MPLVTPFERVKSPNERIPHKRGHGGLYMSAASKKDGDKESQVSRKSKRDKSKKRSRSKKKRVKIKDGKVSDENDCVITSTSFLSPA